MMTLPSVKEGLRRHTLDNDLLVYDPHDEQIHLLNPTAAKVLELMMNGADSESIVAELGADAPQANAADLLELALGELAAARLFIESTSTVEQAPVRGTTRREMILRAASVGAAVAVPSILTLAPNKLLAQAGSGLPNGSICSVSSQCQSGCCGANSAGGCTSNRCVDPGSCSACTSG